MRTACAGRKFFSTEKCRIGLGSLYLLPKDKIYVLLGARPLFILRECSANAQEEQPSVKFSLIGDAYVDGFVYGEAFDLADSGPDGVITIC